MQLQYTSTVAPTQGEQQQSPHVTKTGISSAGWQVSCADLAIHTIN